MIALCIFLLAAAAGTGAQLAISWSNGIEDRTFGPDGPWQAVLARLGGTETHEVPLWPRRSSVSEIPTADISGVYSILDGAVKTGRLRSAAGTWFSSLFREASRSGDEYWDSIELEPKLRISREIKVNATFVAATNWATGALLNGMNGMNYKPSIGILGLGPRGDRSEVTTVPSILEQLKISGEIDRNAFSVHAGSAALGLPILGSRRLRTKWGPRPGGYIYAQGQSPDDVSPRRNHGRRNRHLDILLRKIEQQLLTGIY
ncbi:aspartic-type endopeptidase [Colletotrichum incanum]|uniref:Aspartic-type endopeptidase n=1 Tax=Colletotrichum incanum TaxID=1573173 RepID=A0A162N992_COLIC|nr:aspartic-type endopeptidase [Colletotrichum incanum]